MCNEATKNVITTIVTEFAKTIEMFGLSPLEARLFVYLYLEEKAMTLDEMSEVLGKSKTSMSTSIRSLADMNLVTRVWKKGVRKDLYEANNHLFKTFMTSYVNKWIDTTRHQQDTLRTIQRQLDEQEVSDFPTINSRLKDIIAFHQEIESAFRKIKVD